MTPRNRTELVEAMARVIYAELEGPVANQDASRQMRQWKLAQALATAILPALENAGCVVVPREATEEMLQEFWDETNCDWGADIYGVGRKTYTAMLSANPLAPPTSKE